MYLRGDPPHYIHHNRGVIVSPYEGGNVVKTLDGVCQCNELSCALLGSGVVLVLSFIMTTLSCTLREQKRQGLWPETLDFDTYATPRAVVFGNLHSLTRLSH